MWADTPFAITRILVASFVFVQSGSWAYEICWAMIQGSWTILDMYTVKSAIGMDSAHDFFSVYFLAGSPVLFLLWETVSIICAVFLFIGYRSTTVTILLWILHSSRECRLFEALDLSDQLLRVILFWGIFCNWGHSFSFDSILRTANHLHWQSAPRLDNYLDTIVARICFQIQIVISLVAFLWSLSRSQTFLEGGSFSLLRNVIERRVMTDFEYEGVILLFLLGSGTIFLVLCWVPYAIRKMFFFFSFLSLSGSFLYVAHQIPLLTPISVLWSKARFPSFDQEYYIQLENQHTPIRIPFSLSCIVCILQIPVHPKSGQKPLKITSSAQTWSVEYKEKHHHPTKYQILAELFARRAWMVILIQACENLVDVVGSILWAPHPSPTPNVCTSASSLWRRIWNEWRCFVYISFLAIVILHVFVGWSWMPLVSPRLLPVRSLQQQWKEPLLVGNKGEPWKWDTSWYLLGVLTSNETRDFTVAPPEGGSFTGPNDLGTIWKRSNPLISPSTRHLQRLHYRMVTSFRRGGYLHAHDELILQSWSETLCHYWNQEKHRSTLHEAERQQKFSLAGQLARKVGQEYEGSVSFDLSQVNGLRFLQLFLRVRDATLSPHPDSDKTDTFLLWRYECQENSSPSEWPTFLELSIQ